MHLHEIAAQFLLDSQVSLRAFAPELTLCVTIMVMLIVRLSRLGRSIPAFLIALAGSLVALVALYYVVPWAHLFGAEKVRGLELFTGMLVLDSFSVFLRGFLLVFAVLFVLFTRLSHVADADDAVDFYCLFLGATLGMCLMVAANHLLMVFLAVEMASVPSYALVAQRKYQRHSSEASLKYAVYGAGTAGVMLYGISLVAGVLNTAHLPTVTQQLIVGLPGMPAEVKVVLALGGVMIMVGLAFKLSAVPFHFWCPDVFEGATAEVDAFLSVASKAAALALLVRVAIGFSVPVETQTIARVSAATADGGELQAASRVPQMLLTSESRTPEAREDATASVAPLQPVRNFLCLLIGLFAVVTCTFGNLAAFGQTNIKRLMAYSTIAHAGYMMLAIPAAIGVVGQDRQAARQGIAALVLYIAIYLLMNLGGFAIIAFYRNLVGSEEIKDYSGLIRRSPLIVIMFSIILFSLVGLPPLAGFLGKFAIFAALTQSWQITGNGFLLVLLVVGGLNTAISLFYYLRVVKVMTIDPELDSAKIAAATPLSLMAGTFLAFLALLTIPVLTLIVYTNGLNEWALAATKNLF